MCLMLGRAVHCTKCRTVCDLCAISVLAQQIHIHAGAKHLKMLCFIKTAMNRFRLDFIAFDMNFTSYHLLMFLFDRANHIVHGCRWPICDISLSLPFSLETFTKCDLLPSKNIAIYTLHLGVIRFISWINHENLFFF